MPFLEPSRALFLNPVCRQAARNSFLLSGSLPSPPLRPRPQRRRVPTGARGVVRAGAQRQPGPLEPHGDDPACTLRQVEGGRSREGGRAFGLGTLSKPSGEPSCLIPPRPRSAAPVTRVAGKCALVRRCRMRTVSGHLKLFVGLCQNDFPEVWTRVQGTPTGS